MNRVAKSFRELRDKPCWRVQRGYGTSLTFEFGKPYLDIIEPKNPRPVFRRVRRRFERRLVVVHGQWHLWIDCCDWVVRWKARVVGDSSTSRRIDQAAQFLDSRKLLSVEVRPRGARTVFRFESDVELETRPYDRDSEQWHLYEPNGMALLFRADRKYSYIPKDRDVNKARWHGLGR